MSWSGAMACILIASLAGGLIAGWAAKWWDGREVRAIKRRRKQMRVLYKELNRHRPGVFMVRK